MFDCIGEVLLCVAISLLFVGSLYIWSSPEGRDHPSTVKKRCISAFAVSFVTPFFVIVAHSDEGNKNNVLDLLGLRLDGIVWAIVLPFILTLFLFMGPIVQYHMKVSVINTASVYFHFSYWRNVVQNPIWWRNQVAAPFSEEFTFRACMLSILTRCVGSNIAIFISPLFFGVAHLHHAAERLKNGIPLKTVILMSSFQFLYTYLFGCYCAFIFIRTGHFWPLFIIHAFCNHMGLPDVRELMTLPSEERNKVAAAYVSGCIIWFYLLYPLTNPEWFHNDTYNSVA